MVSKTLADGGKRVGIRFFLPYCLLLFLVIFEIIVDLHAVIKNIQKDPVYHFASSFQRKHFPNWGNLFVFFSQMDGFPIRKFFIQMDGFPIRKLS